MSVGQSVGYRGDTKTMTLSEDKGHGNKTMTFSEDKGHGKNTFV